MVIDKDNQRHNQTRKRQQVSFGITSKTATKHVSYGTSKINHNLLFQENVLIRREITTYNIPKCIRNTRRKVNKFNYKKHFKSDANFDRLCFPSPSKLWSSIIFHYIMLSCFTWRLKLDNEVLRGFSFLNDCKFRLVLKS